MNEKGQIQIGFVLVLVVLIILCGLVALAGSWTLSKFPAKTSTDQSISMIQPQGASTAKDLANSAVNLKNSQANLNNAQAGAVVVDSQGQYAVDMGLADKYHAEACDIRNDCGLQSYQQGLNEAAKDDWMLPAITFGIVALGLAFLFTRR